MQRYTEICKESGDFVIIFLKRARNIERNIENKT